jgi:hypothetical protein
MRDVFAVALPTIGAGIATAVCFNAGSVTIAMVGAFVTGFGVAMTLVAQRS